MVAQKAEQCDVLSQQVAVLEASLRDSRAEADVLREERRLDHQRITQLQVHLKLLEQVCI